MDGWSLVPCASLAATAHTQRESTGRESSPGHEQWEIHLWGGLWVGWRTRLGLMHHGSGEGEQKAEIALQFQLFWHDMLCYSLLGDHTTGTVGLMWSVKVLSLCSRVRCSQNRRNSKTCIMELKGLRKYSEQRCSKTSHKLNFLLGGEYLEEHLNAVSVGLISDYSSFCCTCFVFFKLVSLT